MYGGRRGGKGENGGDRAPAGQRVEQSRPCSIKKGKASMETQPHDGAYAEKQKGRHLGKRGGVGEEACLSH
jgi:hypothetical protein